MIEINEDTHDYRQVNYAAQIAVYDDLLSAPRIITINPAPTNDFIESLASQTYTLAQQQGGDIPYSAIREVTENFIHARFHEIVVSILDKGNTIRFADQGPGITNKEKAQLPGFTSATQPMKEFIRGVGSGLPLVLEYLHFKNGKMTIEDNLESGAVVTLSLKQEVQDIKPSHKTQSELPIPLNEKEKTILRLFAKEGTLGVTDIKNILGLPNSSIYNTLTTLEQAALIEKTIASKRMLTDFGYKVVQSLL